MSFKKTILGTLAAGAGALTLMFGGASFDAKEQIKGTDKETSIQISVTEGKKKYEFFEEKVSLEQAVTAGGLTFIAGGAFGSACNRKKDKCPAKKASAATPAPKDKPKTPKA